jgi:chromosome segregation protein
LESTSQMYTSTLDDLSAQEAEVKRLRAKLRGLELEVKETKELNCKNEEKMDKDGKTIQQLSHDYTLTKSELRQANKQVEQLKSELSTSKGSHADDIDKYTGEVTRATEELEAVKADLANARKLNAQYRENIGSMQDDIDSTKAVLNMTKEDLTKTDMLSKGLDEEVKETRGKVTVLESSMKEKNDTIRRLETSLSGYKRTHSQNIAAISKLEEENKKIKEDYERTSDSFLSTSDNLKALEAEAAALRTQLDDKKRQVDKCEDVIDQLTSELNTTQVRQRQIAQILSGR